jgi:hypothetical protein
MDASMAGALQQAYLRQLISMASGGGGSGDVFSPMLKRATQQGIQAEVEAED